jgi:hypothetical protein
MIRKTLVFALLSTVTAMAGERMTIWICNLGNLRDQTVVHARKVVTEIFGQLQIEVRWTGCEGPGISRVAWPGSNIVLRLRRAEPPAGAPVADADLMGMAFTSARNAGNLADAYYRAIRRFARRNQADAPDVLAYVVAHEIGHLLLGPGHVEGTIMAARWDARTLAAVRQRRLTFNAAQRAAIYRELRARTTMLAKAPANGE